ncbi:MAG: hypothetical protein ABR537_10475 [Gemmatimonadales bacterium]
MSHASARIGTFDRRALVTPAPDPIGVLTRDSIECQFIPHATGGTSFKFDCALAGGEIVRVKYGHEPEIHAEVAATRLLSALGYATDHMYLVPRLRCNGCPANPFVTMLVLDKIGLEPSRASGYRDFEWVSVERKFEAPPIEDDSHEGWAWWELKDVNAPREELDALRLLAVFLAHWDNKADNQRLVCMDHDAASSCRNPILMIQDLGSTFGPMKVNLSQWREMPVWIDRAGCVVSMKALPYQGGTFSDARISEAARVRVGEELESFSDAELRTWFGAARFPQYYASTDDGKDMEAWLQAYHRRVSQIRGAGPCSG